MDLAIDSAGTGAWHLGDAPDLRMQAAARKAVDEMSQSNDLAGGTMQQSAAAADALNAVLDAVGQMHTLNAQIAVATGQQSTAMGEINSNISHIDQVANSIADGVNASMAMADDLAGSATALQQAVARFRF